MSQSELSKLNWSVADLLRGVPPSVRMRPCDIFECFNFTEAVDRLVKNKPLYMPKENFAGFDLHCRRRTKPALASCSRNFRPVRKLP